MVAALQAVEIDVADPDRVAGFWARLLDREPHPEPGAVLLPGTATQVGLRFRRAAASRFGDPDPLHLHVTSPAEGDQQRTVATALALGGRHVDVGQLPEEGHIVLADPGGDAFCVIEHGNAFLAGCGPLGEVACDGTRDVGLFWSRALGWPLVWDENEETAIQAPGGGTKVAWGGPPVERRSGHNRQRFALVTGDLALEKEVARLVELGARPIADTGTDSGAGRVMELPTRTGMRSLSSPDEAT